MKHLDILGFDLLDQYMLYSQIEREAKFDLQFSMEKSGELLDIAVDPLEGTNFIANNLPNALSVLAVTNKGNLLQAPDIYMEKIAIASGFPDNLVDLDFDHFFNQWLRSRMPPRRSRLRFAGWGNYFSMKIHAGGAFSG